MRYRKLSPTGDFVFGRGQNDFYIDQPEAVAQAVATRLRLWTGQWFLDTSDGMDWLNEVLGVGTANTRDIAIQMRAVQTPGVVELQGYSSTANQNTRQFTASFTLMTVYGAYKPAQTKYITQPQTELDQPPPRPINVAVTVISDTAVSVSWSPYQVGS